MRTGIVHNDDVARLAAVHDEGLIQNLATKRLPANFGACCHDVPAILYIHGNLPAHLAAVHPDEYGA